MINKMAVEEASVHVMGRRSSEIMGPHAAASKGPIAVAMNERPRAVFSQIQKSARRGPLQRRTSVRVIGISAKGDSLPA
jgi:hypothetical protein